MPPAPQEHLLLLLGRVAEREPQEEAVHLRLGQRIGAEVLDRVLRRDDHEGLRAAARRSDSTVTAPSFIASSSADWVFGVARLISSASTMLAKIGPGVELEPLASARGRPRCRGRRPAACRS